MPGLGIGFELLCLLAPVPQSAPATPATPPAARAPVAPAIPSPQGPTGPDKLVEDPLATAEAIATLNAAAGSPSPDRSAALAELLQSPSPNVAARAAWLLGKHKAAAQIEALQQAVRQPHSEQVRVQAIGALATIASKESASTATAALDDDSATVRTIAAQLLGRLQHRESADALVAMIRSQSATAGGPKHDVAAALLALHDIGAVGAMLPAAAAAGATKDTTAATALAYLLQQLTPRMAAKDEAIALLAVLDHPMDLVRRYAIERLGELADPMTAGALERRLASEPPALQPLLQTTLAQVRGDAARLESDLGARTRANAEALLALAQRHIVVVGVAGGMILLLLIMLLISGRRRRREHNAAFAAAMLEPSAEFAARQSAADPMEPDSAEAMQSEHDAIEAEELVGAGSRR